MVETLKIFDLTPYDLNMILLSTVFFAVALSLIGKFLLSPLLVLVEAREKSLVGARAEAAGFDKKSAEIAADYEKRLLDKRIEFAREKIEQLKTSREQASNLIERAEKDAEQFTSKYRAELNEQAARLRKELSQEAQKIAGVLVEKFRQPPTNLL